MASPPPPDLGWLIGAVTAPGYVWSAGFSAEYSGAHAEDIAVPIAFYGPGIPAQRLEPVSTVDIGPTLATLIGVDPTEPIDGRVLPEVVGH